MSHAKLLSALLLLTCLVATSSAEAQYNRAAGRSAAPKSEAVQIDYFDDSGVKKTRTETREVRRDQYGNAAGTNYDLAIDGAFEGQTILVLQLYPFEMENARKATKEKGFSMYRFNGQVPDIKVFKEALAKSNQFWLISGDRPQLSEAHLKAIEEFFHSGRGVYIWGDNQPFYADANALATRLIDSGMDGDLPGAKTVALSEGEGKPGVRRDHLITTGLEYVFEGITIATIRKSEHLTPIIWGSAGNLVTAAYEHDGKRAILDGGFTRLYNNWDSAGTGRYVKNAAAWLANAERFGAAVTTKPATTLEGDAPSTTPAIAPTQPHSNQRSLTPKRR